MAALKDDDGNLETSVFNSISRIEDELGTGYQAEDGVDPKLMKQFQDFYRMLKRDQRSDLSVSQIAHLALNEMIKRTTMARNYRVTKIPYRIQEERSEDTVPMDAKELYDLFQKNAKDTEERFRHALEDVDARRAADIAATEKRLTDAIEKLALTSEKALINHSAENKEWQEQFKKDIKDELKSSDTRSKWMIVLMISTFVALLGVIAALITKL